MKIKRLVVEIIAAMAAFVGQAESSAPFRLSLKSDGVRQSAGDETLTYSSQWDGGDGATVTIAQDGAVVADGLSGEGTRSWSVQKTGEYTLTHTTYTNGIAGKVETATFVVPGPELTFEYDGGPFVGGKVTINGNLDGWTIYYTLDGSTPTTESTEYTGPFSLSAAVTVKAFAVSGNGFTTDVIGKDYAIYERPRIENVRARQREAPNNGLVDIEFTVLGDPSELYAIAFMATNILDGSYASVKTLWMDGTPEKNSQFFLAPGDYHFVWHYARDKTDDVPVSSLVVGVNFTDAKQTMFVSLNGGSGATRYGVSYMHGGLSETDAAKEMYRTSYICLRLVPPGTYMAQTDDSIYGNPKDQYLSSPCKITLTNPFYIGVFEVTQGQFQNVVGSTWAYFKSSNSPYYWPTRPVESLEWSYIRGTTVDYVWPDTKDVAPDSFIGRLRAKTGLQFDLPTEAQWEYACRAGTAGMYYTNIAGVAYNTMITDSTFNSAKLARFSGNSGWGSNGGNYVPLQSAGCYSANTEGGTAAVGSYRPNAWGLYDMLGNVHEWVLGRIGAGVDPEYKMPEVLSNSAYLRGGSWRMDAYGCMCRFRMHDLTTKQGYTDGGVDKGFRVVCPVDSTTYFSPSTIVGSDIPFSVGDVTVSNCSNKYDGAAHGVGVTVKEGIEDVVFKYAMSQTGEPPVLPKSWSNEFPTITDVGSMTVWCEIAALGYITQTNSATVVISPREVTLTSGSASKVYDGTSLVNGNVTVGGDGFVDGEGASYNVTGSQTNVGESENAFAYALNDNTKASNYTITTVNGTLTVTKANVGGGIDGGEEPGAGEVPTGGLSKFDASFVYDGEGHTINTNALKAAFGSAMEGASAIEYAVDDGSVSGGVGHAALPWVATAPVYTNAGEYVVWYRVTNPNYEEFVHAAKLSITKRQVTVSVAGHTATCAYDTTEKTVSGYDIVTEDELYDVTEDTVFSGSHGVAALPSVARTDVGTTVMGLSAANFANKNENFEVTYLVSDGWLKIKPRIIGDDPVNWDIRLARNPMYDGTEQSTPITQVAFVKPDGNLDYIPYELSGNTATDSGNYIVRITGTGNYSGTVEKEWAITPRNVTLTSGSAEWVYDGEAHSQSAVSVTGDGFADGEGASYSAFPVVRHVADAVTPRSNTFEYTLNANTKAQNYVITTVNGTVKMSPCAVTLTAPTKQKQYDGTPLTFGADEMVTTLTNGGQGLPALPNGEAFTLGDFASITEAGRVDATFTVADGTALMSDYAITVVPGTLTVMKNATEITVTAKSGSWVYDGAAHTLHEYEATNLGVLQPGDALEVAFSDESVVTTPIDGEAQNGVVANVITSVRVIRNGKDDVTANYTLAPYNGTLTVMKRPVTLTSKIASKVYDGDALTAHEVEVGGDGFVGEDGATYVFTGSQTEKGKSKNTFTYSLKGGTNAAFYDITKVEGELEVTALDIAGGDDEDWEIVLGPALTYTGLEQIQTLASVCYKGLPVDYSVTGNAATDAGAYSMMLTGQGNFSGEKAVSWSIAPKALTLTAGSGSRVYDGTPFTVGAVTAVGFVAGEGAQYECDGAQKDVGSSANDVSAIRWNANTKGGNYTVTKVAGTLTVTPRPLTLTAANISKPYDGTPLTLTAADVAADGLVAGESFIYSNFASRTEAGQV